MENKEHEILNEIKKILASISITLGMGFGAQIIILFLILMKLYEGVRIF